VAKPAELWIVVGGEATVRRMPDVAVVSLSVTIREKTVDGAREQTNARTSAILGHIRELGIPDADVQAPSLTLQPTYDYSRGSPKLTGYEAARPMTVRVRDTALLGPLLDAVVDDGATQVHATRMELDDPEEARREALANALTVARERARALAHSVGRTLGAPGHIEEETGQPLAPVREIGMLRATAEATPTEVALGEVEISARLRTWWEVM
jgi:uncharacterized protein YggE